MNQPMNFTWTPEGAEMAKKAGVAGGISETGPYEGVITSAIYIFGRDGNQSQARELRDERQKNLHHSGPRGGVQVNPYTAQNGIPQSRLQQTANQRTAAAQEPPMFDDDIP